MLKQKQYVLSNGAREELRYAIEKEHKRHEHSGNARLVRNMIERAIRRQAVRLLEQKVSSAARILCLLQGKT